MFTKKELYDLFYATSFRIDAIKNKIQETKEEYDWDIAHNQVEFAKDASESIIEYTEEIKIYKQLSGKIRRLIIKNK